MYAGNQVSGGMAGMYAGHDVAGRMTDDHVAIRIHTGMGAGNEVSPVVERM